MSQWKAIIAVVAAAAGGYWLGGESQKAGFEKRLLEERLSHLNDNAKPVAEPAPAAPPPAPPAPTHFYATRDGHEYAYERALSAEDRLKGLATSPLLAMTYFGERDGVHQVHHKENNVASFVYECSSPCEFVTVYQYFSSEFVGKKQMRNTPGSLIGFVFADAAAGQLEPRVYVDGGKRKRAWAGKDGVIKFVPAPT